MSQLLSPPSFGSIIDGDRRCYNQPIDPRSFDVTSSTTDEFSFSSQIKTQCSWSTDLRQAAHVWHHRHVNINLIGQRSYFSRFANCHCVACHWLSFLKWIIRFMNLLPVWKDLSTRFKCVFLEALTGSVLCVIKFNPPLIHYSSQSCFLKLFFAKKNPSDLLRRDWSVQATAYCINRCLYCVLLWKRSILVGQCRVKDLLLQEVLHVLDLLQGLAVAVRTAEVGGSKQTQLLVDAAQLAVQILRFVALLKPNGV